MFAVKRRLKLNRREQARFACHAGFSRFVYNYGLELFWQSVEAGLKASDATRLAAIKKCLTNVTKKRQGFEWTQRSAGGSSGCCFEQAQELSSKVYQSALQALGAALSRWRQGIEIVDRWFPSSKTCRKCGEKHVLLKLSNRIFVCPSCGHTEDRDLQAAKNLANASDELCSRVGSTRIYACGQVAADCLG